MDDSMSFDARYGPWAVIAGASDGIGEAAARELAARGVDVVLLARRTTMIEQLAEELRAAHGTDARAIAVDLSEPDASARIIAATDGLEVGMLLYCAGADPNYAPLLARPIEAATDMVQRNCVVPLQLIHHYAPAMVGRGHGGIVVLSSGAALVGAANVVAYAASKAFDTVMTEALWAELEPFGVDVLGLVLSATDTPAFRELMLARGVISSLDEAPPVPNMSTVAAVTEALFANLGNGPTVFADELLAAGATFFGSMPRNDAVKMMMQAAASTMGAS